MSKSILIILLSLTFFSACQPPGYNQQPIHTILESPLIPNQVEVGSAQTEPLSSGAKEANTIVAAYAEAMKIDYAEAERRLILQDEMIRVGREIAQDEAYFASWLEHQPTIGLVVSFTTADGQERISKYLEGVEWADLVTVQQSDITRDALISLRGQIVQAAEKTGLNFGSGIDYRTGQVKLYTDKVVELRNRLGTQLTARAEGAAIMSRLEFVKETGDAPADYDYPYLLGGHAIRTGTRLESPLIPNQVPALLDNQWILTEVIYNGASRDFSGMRPVLLNFYPGFMNIDACSFLGYYFDTKDVEETNEYRLIAPEDIAFLDCPYGGFEQEKILDKAIMTTNRYEIVGDTLILSGLHLSGEHGAQARLTFVIDNETTKPR